jgi:hypothetical protein
VPAGHARLLDVLPLEVSDVQQQEEQILIFLLYGTFQIRCGVEILLGILEIVSAMKVQVVLLVCCMLGATVQRCMISNAIEAKLMLRQRIFRTDEEHERCRKQYQEEFENRCRTGRPLGECNRPAKPTYKRSEEVSDDDEDER